jgi:hypothetical protein
MAGPVASRASPPTRRCRLTDGAPPANPPMPTDGRGDASGTPHVGHTAAGEDVALSAIVLRPQRQPAALTVNDASHLPSRLRGLNHPAELRW